jgi:hypothetical protein
MCEDVDRQIGASDCSEYDLRFAFFRHVVQSMTLLNRPAEIIRYAFQFLTRIADRVRSDASVTEQLFELWFVKALTDLTTICHREREMGRSDTAIVYASVLELYADHLTRCRKLFVAARDQHLFDAEDPLAGAVPESKTDDTGPFRGVYRGVYRCVDLRQARGVSAVFALAECGEARGGGAAR